MKKIMPATESDLSSLALKAATELDDRLGTMAPMPHPTSSAYALGNRLRHLFPTESRPQLPPEMTGLVSGVVENWEQIDSADKYHHSSQAAQKIADLLQSTKIETEDIKRLIRFCLSLFYATQPKAVMHDVPEDHEHILSMC